MMNTVGERFEWALHYARKTKAEVARYCGITTSAVSSWTKGRAKSISAENNVKVATFLGVSSDWLATGQGSPTASDNPEHISHTIPGLSYIEIPECTVTETQGSEAEGRLFSFPQIPDEPPALFPISFFKKHQVAPSDCRRLGVLDKEMFPTLQPGDRILVDCTRDQPIVSGGVYALLWNGRFCIRRLQKKFSGAIGLSADNAEFGSDEVSAEQWSKNARLIGRLIHRASSSFDH